ncbi:MAG: cobyric acid synthase [Candidatus Omnitrophica bacterium]|nr:cobyric acid synthase [Candidatus Omnitrophota bacterium]
MIKTKSLQICGTGSGVGKSVIVSALCRIFLQEGYKVAPFKAQNMALNSFVTRGRGEIGRAQATQAQACRIEPTVEMNPVLIKPTSDVGAQVIVLGKSIGNMNALRYTKYKSKLLEVVRSSFRRLADDYEVIVIEGAGSPAEINLKSHDIVNLKMAAYAGAPVILVGDIDKGGVFAWIIGTLELLTPKERKMIKGIIINKFRGDIRLLKPGIDFLEKRTGIKVLGVIPYYRNIKIPEEDAVPLDSFKNNLSGRNCKLNIDVLYLPHISNFTDFDALEKESDVCLRYVKRPDELSNPDMIIIPGTKNTISDLRYLMKAGFINKILSIINSDKQVFLFGICGGYQMLGKKIIDEHGLESRWHHIQGMNVLPVETRLGTDKILAQIEAKEIVSGLELSGYEIHHGLTRVTGRCKPLFRVFECNGRKIKYNEGVISSNQRILGTYIHGIFDASPFRRCFLNRLRQSKGWPALAVRENFNPDKELNKLAQLVRDNIDMDILHKILIGGLG